MFNAIIILNMLLKNEDFIFLFYAKVWMHEIFIRNSKQKFHLSFEKDTLLGMHQEISSCGFVVVVAFSYLLQHYIKRNAFQREAI